MAPTITRLQRMAIDCYRSDPENEENYQLLCDAFKHHPTLTASAMAALIHEDLIA